jgi:hypothetical protein
MALVETKIKIEDRFLKSINNIAKRKNTTKTRVINDMIETGLKTTETRDEKIKRLTVNNPTHKKKLSDLEGIIDLGENTNAVELKRQAHTKDLKQ